MIASPEEVVKRDYLEQIFIEPRTKTTAENVSNLNNSIFSLLKRIDNEKIKIFDTTKIDERQTAIILAEDIIDIMKKKYDNENKNKITI